MDKVYNIINLTGWSYLLTKVGLSVAINHHQYDTINITQDLYMLRAMQLFQILDIILISLGLSKGSLVGAFFQILARNIVTLIFMQP